MLSYKMPITFRYGFFAGFLAGFTLGLIKKRPSYALVCSFVTTPTIGLGLCYEEFRELAKL